MEKLEKLILSLLNEKKFEELLHAYLAEIIGTENSDTSRMGNGGFGEHKIITAVYGRIIFLYEKKEIGDILYHRILKYFDENLNWLYKRNNFDEKKALSHEKVIKIREIIKNTESQLINLLSSSNFISLKTVNEFQQSLMRLISTKEFQLFLSPFFPSFSFDRFQLSNLFKAINEFNQTNQKQEKILIYNESKKYFEDYIQEANISELIYGKKYVVPLGEVLYKLIKDDVFSEGAGSATVLLSPIDKKYPLHEVSKFSLFVRLINDGPGFAENIHLHVTSSNLNVKKDEHIFRSMDIGSIEVEIPIELEAPIKSGSIDFRIVWRNIDGTYGENNGRVDLSSQPTNIDWDGLKQKTPYSTWPIEEKEKLIGREDLLDELIIKIKNNNVGSCFLYGQKRIGKTSIVKTLKNCFSGNENYVIAYVEGNAIRQPHAENTVNELGKRICKNLGKEKNFIKSIQVKEFSGSLSPLLDFIEEIWEFNSNIKVLIIIDEFDEFPIEIYKPGPIGDTLFGNFRGLTNENNIGFILVGSENIPKIISMQGFRSNNWDVKQLDAFDYKTEYNSYASLIRKPVNDIFEYSDEAVEYIYEMTNGNPYFTNIICSEIFNIACDKKDASISRNDAENAVTIVIENANENRFQHYWMDGILDDYQKKIEISITRRRILIAIAEAIRKKNHNCFLTFNEIEKEFVPSELSTEKKEVTCQRELRDYLNRKILSVDEKGNYRLVTRIFEEWLINRGVFEIITTFQDIDDRLKEKREDEKFYIKPIEIESLFGKITYMNKKITLEEVRKWIEQFGSNRNQREIFALIENIKFYNNEYIVNVLQNLHKRAHFEIDARIQSENQFLLDSSSETRFKTKDLSTSKSMNPTIGQKPKKYFAPNFRNDIAITYLNDDDKYLAKVYAETNKVLSNLVKTTDEINSIVLNDIKSIVLITDFIDNFETIFDRIRSIYESHSNLFVSRNLILNVISVVTLVEVKEKLKESLVQGGIIAKVYVGDSILTSEATIEKHSNGKRILDIIDKYFPVDEVTNSLFSYNILLEHNCPQSSLPVYWYPRKGWHPLFPNAYEIYNPDPQYRNLCYELGERLERTMQDILIDILMEKYGNAENERWWGEGTPSDVRSKCAQRWEEENRKDRVWNYLDIIDYPKIINKNEELKQFFYYDEENSGKQWDQLSKAKGESWFGKFNEIRKRYAHPSRKPPAIGDYEYLKKLHDWFFSNLKLQRGG